MLILGPYDRQPCRRIWVVAPVCILSFFILSFFPATALAQQTLNPDRNEPLEITADQTLEWDRNNQQYIARGNVIARQGGVRILTDTLTADYRETAASSFEIYRLTADGNVKIISQGNTAYGGKAIYDVDRGVAVMTGNNLRLTSPDQSVTARDSFEYWVTEGKLSAIGKAHVVRGQDTLDADRVTAIFKEDAQGNRRIESLFADNHVVITTPTEVLTGKQGRYRAATNIAELSGDVTIRRGPNVLEGERAEVNLSTNISKMHGGAGQNGRVRGVFYPDSEDKAKSNPQATPQTSLTPQPKTETKQGQYTPRLLGQ